MRKPQRTSAVVGCDDHKRLAARDTCPDKVCRIVYLPAGDLNALASACQATTVEEEHDGKTSIRLVHEYSARHSDVQVEAIPL